MYFQSKMLNTVVIFIFAATSIKSESNEDSRDKTSFKSYSSSSSEKYVNGKRVDFSNKDSNKAYSSQGAYKIINGKKVYDDFKDQQFAQDREANPYGEFDRSAFFANHPHEGAGYSGFYKDNGKDDNGPWDFSQVYGDYE